MYLEGSGVPRDVLQAVTWYSRAAGGGDVMAAFTLGSIYEDGAEGLPRDAGRAAPWYRQAAETGLVSAQYRLGLLYRDGRGVARSRDEATAWFRKAADQGEANAQLELGVLLTDGPARDVVEAHTWLNLAASRWKHEDTRVRAAALRDALAKTMTPTELAEAYRRATDWQDRHAWGQ
jgi:TPR repeat protein